MDSVDTIYQEYSARCNAKLSLRKMRPSNPESYHLYSKKGEWIVEGGAPSPLICGIVNLSIGLSSGHLPEFVVEQAPQFPLRPLWVSKREELPADAQRRIYELGYNALIVSDPSMIVEGVPTILKCQNIDQLPENFHGILWESHIDLEGDGTKKELLENEMHRVESLLSPNRNLYYYVHESPEILLHLAHRAGPRTVILFSSDDSNLHPLWNALRSEQCSVVTPLMPVVNIGGVGVERGLWVGIPHDLIEHTLYRMERHHFIGAIAMTDHIPKIDTLLGCHLWVAARSQWKRTPVFDLVDTWGRAFRPEWELPSFFKECEIARQIVTQLTTIDSDAFQEIKFKLALIDKALSSKKGPFTDILRHFSTSAYHKINGSF